MPKTNILKNDTSNYFVNFPYTLYENRTDMYSMNGDT